MKMIEESQLGPEICVSMLALPIEPIPAANLFESDQHTTVRYLSNQTSCRRKLLMMLLTIIVQFFT